MPYVVVDNFSGGLDSRRHVLNAKTGTASVLKNAHITRGGEIEKRKAFNLFLSHSTLGYATFGLEAASDGIHVFRYNETRGENGIVDNLGPLVSGAPDFIVDSISYPLYPDSTFSESLYYLRSPFLNKVAYSTVYGGKPFVIAEFGFSGEFDELLHRIPYYDGYPVKDWYQGYHFGPQPAGYGQPLHMFEALASYFPVSGYTASYEYSYSLSAPIFDITGASGKKFTVSTQSDIEVFNPVISTITVGQEAVAEVPSKGSFKISSGSTKVAIVTRGYKGSFYGILNPASLPGIRSIRAYASNVALADGIDLIGWTATTGLKYNTVTPPGGYLSHLEALYYNIEKAINDNTSAGLSHGYTAKYINGYLDVPLLTIYGPEAAGGNLNTTALQIEFDSNPTGITGLNQFVDTASIAASPYNVSRYIATFGIFSGGTYNTIKSVTVDGVEVLGSAVPWNTSHALTASAVATQINTYTSSVEYVASVEDVSKIVLTSVAGLGQTPNGKVVSVTVEGSVVVSDITAFAGGMNYTPAIAQVTRINYDDVSGSTEEKKISITIIDPDNPTVPIIVGASRVAGKSANFSTTYKSKEYAGSGSTLYFSAVNDATKWDIYDTGSGFIDMSSNFGGREDLTGVGIYQNYLAVFSRRSVQLWSMDADPANNTQAQVIANTGALAPDSIVSVGSIDLLYLADNGVRSLRARENTDTAFSSDIGSAIDGLIIQHMADTGDAKYSAKAIIEPVDGRYWIAIHDKIYVLSYFPGSNISAWSIYEPGFVVEEMVARQDKVFLKSSNGDVYIYGNTDGGSLSEYDSCEVVIELPYLDGNKPATYKEAKGIDMTCAGEWKVYLGFDHTNPSARDLVATVTQPTFSLGKITATGAGTHFGPRFVNQSAGPALLANFIVHFDEMHSKHEAG